MDDEKLNLLTNQEIPTEVRQVLAETLFSREERREQLRLDTDKLAAENRRFYWNTPLVAAVAGLITLSATFVFDSFTSDKTTENTITLEQVRKELELSEARLKQELDAASEENLARLEAQAKEREFQYEIVRSELTNDQKSNAERASVLLFLVRAGVLSSLNEEQLSAMAEEQRQNPTETIIPSLTAPRENNVETTERYRPFGAGAPVSKNGNWLVFSSRANNRCMIGAFPNSSVAKRGDRVVAVRRGDIFLVVNRDVPNNKLNEITFSAGYPIGSNSKLTVGSTQFKLFHDGDFAVPNTIEDNEEILTLLLSSSTVKIDALSARGTATQDEFQLDGFAKSLAEMEMLCPNR